MRIFHVALASDWERAQSGGRYTGSTLGRSLREEGFVHCSHADQWQQVRDTVFADVTEPLVLLTIDTEALDAPVVEEAPAGGGEAHPHVYGAVPVTAVVDASPLPRPPAGPDAPGRQPPPGAQPSLSRLFLEEMMFRAVLGFGVMVVAGVPGFAVQQATGDDTAALVTVLVLLVVGGVVAVVLTRRRDARIRASRQ